MSAVFLLGRLITGIYFFYNGINHFTKLKMLTQYAATKGVPAPSVAVIVAGVLLLLGGLSIITGYKPKIGILLLVIFLLPVTLAMHRFWTVSDPMARISEMVNFTKNFALLGSLLMISTIKEPWEFSIRGGK